MELPRAHSLGCTEEVILPEMGLSPLPDSQQVDLWLAVEEEEVAFHI